MNQKITLRFADHVLIFAVSQLEITEVKLAYRRKWPYEFTRADGNFHVNFDQVLWMKISPGDDAGTEAEVERVYLWEVQKEAHTLSGVVPFGGGDVANRQS